MTGLSSSAAAVSLIKLFAQISMDILAYYLALLNSIRLHEKIEVVCGFLHWNLEISINTKNAKSSTSVGLPYKIDSK